jgi:hypothetical protein
MFSRLTNGLSAGLLTEQHLARLLGGLDPRRRGFSRRAHRPGRGRLSRRAFADAFHPRLQVREVVEVLALQLGKIHGQAAMSAME